MRITRVMRFAGLFSYFRNGKRLRRSIWPKGEMTMKRFMLVCLLFVCLWGFALAEEYTVDPAGNGDFVSLTEAVAAVADGDTLVLAGGLYDSTNETFPVVVDKCITIRAKEGETPIISSPRLVAAMELNADGIHVSGLQIDFLRNGMWAQANDLVLENCTFTLGSEEWRTSSCGIWIGGAKRMTMTGCTFNGCGVALAGPHITAASRGLPALTGMFEVGEDIEYFTTHTFTDNIVNGLPMAYVVDLDNAVYSEPCGQLLAVACDNTTFTGLVCNRASMGIEVVYCTNTLVENCTANDAGIFGIYVAKSEDCILRGCTADNGAHGFDLRAIHRCVVDSCSATGGGQGMFFSMAWDSLLVNCDIIETGTGFYAAAGDRNHMDNCRIIGNQLGIYIQKEPNFTVTNCYFKGNWNTGARSTLAPGFALIGCTLEGNWVGAMSNNSEGVFYYGNTFLDNENCSLYMKGNTMVRMLYNEFTEADAALVQIYECPDMLVWND